VSKTIFSTAHNQGVLKFVDAGTSAIELENGAAINEPTTYAVRVAIEQAVFEMIQEGAKKKLWTFKHKNAQFECKTDCGKMMSNGSRSGVEDSNSPTKQK
jgi:hypothetical protein